VTSAAVALAVLAGLAGSVQVAVMGRFGGRIGVLEALTFSTGVQLILSFAILAVARTGFGGIAGAFRTPAWMWLGGVMGLTVVASITFAQPRIGATARSDPDRRTARDGRRDRPVRAVRRQSHRHLAAAAIGIALLESAQACRSFGSPCRKQQGLDRADHGLRDLGSTYLGIAVAGETIPPLFAASTRSSRPAH